MSRKTTKKRIQEYHKSLIEKVINSTLARYLDKTGGDSDAATKIPFYVALENVATCSPPPPNKTNSKPFSENTSIQRN